MNIGDIITLSIEDMTRDFHVITVEDDADCPYVIYRLMNSGAIHLLYVKKGVTLPVGSLDISGHIILFEDEVKGKDFYLMINKDFVLPL